jgi:thymidylate synthase (FAD)
MNIVPMKVELLDYMGNDLAVVDAARVSFQKESMFADSSYNPTDGDRKHPRFAEYLQYLEDQFHHETLTFDDYKLVYYLAKHNHWTPFGHATLKFRVKAPIFVARQLVKHQVGLVWNEVSRRYVSDEPEFWFPEVWRAKPEGSIKQGSGHSEIVHIKEDWEPVNVLAEVMTGKLLTLYTTMIEGGVAPEQARMILPQNMMTEWVWTGSLAAFVRVCKLRLDPHAQAETREIAEQIDKLSQPIFPVAWQALLEN